MRRHSWIVILLAASMTLAVGCGDDSAAPNVTPTVTLLTRPDSGAVLDDRALFRWTGTDPDGSVDHYEFSRDSETEFTATDDSSYTWVFTRDDGTDSNPMPHVFRVRTVDNRGLASGTASSSFVVAVLNEPPTLQFTEFPPPGEYAGDSVALAWEGEDPDGEVTRYEYVLGDSSGLWTATVNTSLSIDFSTGIPIITEHQGAAGSPGGVFATAHDPQEYQFYLRAVDAEGKRSRIFRTGFFAGPLNRVPEIEILTSPQGVVEGEAVWEWRVTDPDGEILRTQFAVDLSTESDWTRWDADTLRLVFTREDGTREHPVDHTFHLRTQDNDSTFSAVTVLPFTVGVPDLPPEINFVQFPDPETAVLYRFTYIWEGMDDDDIATYEYSVDDGDWVTTLDTVVTLAFSAPEVDAGTCGPAGCFTRGNHVFRVRATDTAAQMSATLESAMQAFNRSAVTRITSPTGAGGEVTGATSMDVTGTVLDVDGAGAPVMFHVAVIEVADFGDVPDPQVAVDGLAEEDWVLTGTGSALAATLSLESGKKYVVAFRATDEASSREAQFAYGDENNGKNVLKITVP